MSVSRNFTAFALGVMISWHVVGYLYVMLTPGGAPEASRVTEIVLVSITAPLPAFLAGGIYVGWLKPCFCLVEPKRSISLWHSFLFGASYPIILFSLLFSVSLVVFPFVSESIGNATFTTIGFLSAFGFPIILAEFARRRCMPTDG
jgi:hypothetical protein